ncbi:MAG: FecR domain-containing protein [Solimonas sp.]
MVEDKKTVMDRALEEAAGWHARMSASDCSAQDRRAFERWRSQSDMHARAYARVEDVSRQLEALGRSDSRLRAMADHAYAAAGGSEVRGLRVRRRALWALAASVVAAVGVLLLVRPGLPGRSDVAHYETQQYERRDVALADGSVVKLDVDSEFTVDLSRRERRIDLLRGRAIFEVRHDASRPFVVHFGRERVTALGTVFEVWRADHETWVTLEEGSVLVATETQPAAEGEKLSPGEQISVAAGSMPVSWSRRSVDPQMVTNWSRGRLVFRGTPLAEVLTEINRYSVKKVRLGNPALAGLPVSGSFVTGNNDVVMPALVAVLPVDVVDDGGEFVLYQRH